MIASRPHTFARLFTIAALTFACCAALPTQDAFAGAPIRQGGNLGVGLGGGTSTSGLSLKYFMSDGQALQLTAGLRYGGRDGDGRGRGQRLGVGLDYLLELPEFYQHSVVNIGPAIGLGAGVGIGDEYLDVAVSGVAGLEFNFNPIPIDLVLEWRPTLHVIPGVDLDLVGFTGHIRFYF